MAVDLQLTGPYDDDELNEEIANTEEYNDLRVWIKAKARRRPIARHKRHTGRNGSVESRSHKDNTDRRADLITDYHLGAIEQGLDDAFSIEDLPN